jgi:hypothetical protein
MSFSLKKIAPDDSLKIAGKLNFSSMLVIWAIELNILKMKIVIVIIFFIALIF